MKIKYKGYWVNLDLKKLIKSSWKTKKEFFGGQIKYKIERIKDYWVGYVNVRTQNIYCCSDNPSEKGINKLYEVNIVAGRKHSGQMFNAIGKDTCKKIINDWEFCDKKSFELCLDLGCGMSQSYTFTKRQKNMLIDQLKPLLDKDWYKDDEE